MQISSRKGSFRKQAFLKRAPRLLFAALGLMLFSFTACTTSEDDSDDVLAALALASLCSPTETANYRLTFTAVWSVGTHPVNFPANPHFSPLIGATHSAANLVWQSGGTATAGMKQVAELGGTTTITSEINAYIAAGAAGTLISDTGGALNSPGTRTVDFSTNNCNGLVSVVTMIAPSPDWFVGVNGMSLMANGAFLASATHTLYGYDAGTDSGTVFTSANSETSPQGTIAELTDAPFVTSGTKQSMGTFVFTKL